MSLDEGGMKYGIHEDDDAEGIAAVDDDDDNGLEDESIAVEATAAPQLSGIV